MKKVIGYAGICENSIDKTSEENFTGNKTKEERRIYAIYPNKKTAEKLYETVVKVEINI